jgi:Cu2+-exporting ATPase/Cu+-exporting ATPase
MESQNIKVNGMSCASCAMKVTKTLSKQAGVTKSDVNFASEKVHLEYDPSVTTLEKLNDTITPLGYSLVIPKKALPIEKGGENPIKEKALFAFPIAILVFFLMLWESISMQYSSFPRFFIPTELFSKILLVLATIILFYAGKQFVNAIPNFIKNGAANMDTLVGIGTSTAYIYSFFITLFPQLITILGLPSNNYFDITIVVIGFILFGKYLESNSKQQTGEAIKKLINLQTKNATVVRDGVEVEIAIEEVVLGDIIVVKPGSKIPVDGIVLEGTPSIDESMISGEPLPVDKVKGEKVFSGTINRYSIFTLKAEKIGSETLLSEIIKMVEDAQGSKAPIQKLADKISEIFVPIVLVIAALSFVGWTIVGFYILGLQTGVVFGMLAFVGVLSIACPCALGLATPTAIIVGVGKGAENGILIKNAESLERLHKVDTIVFDKTGTITTGKPKVVEVILPKIPDLSENELINIAGSIEKTSEHPIAMAIVEKNMTISHTELHVNNSKIIEGMGISAKIKDTEYLIGNEQLMLKNNIKVPNEVLIRISELASTSIFVSDKKRFLGAIAISDTMKDNSQSIINKLNKMGIRTVMITGDNQEAAKLIAEKAGITEFHARVQPGGKAEIIKEYQKNNRYVAMIGDGVNDAPALAQANVGIAMGTGTDIAMETADITILAGDLEKVAKAINLSKKTMRTIKQNLFWAFIYNIVGIPLAAGLFYPVLGVFLNPIFAGISMSFSSITVISNSLRLKLTKI